MGGAPDEGSQGRQVDLAPCVFSFFIASSTLDALHECAFSFVFSPPPSSFGCTPRRYNFASCTMTRKCVL